MEVEQVLRDFGLILGAGLVAQFLATVTRVPEMILLVAAGAVVGPSVLGLVSNPLGGVGAQLGHHRGLPGQAARPDRRPGSPQEAQEREAPT